jgi:hypothetical protein
LATELWGIVSGKIQKPSSDDDKIATWETKEAKAAGWIFLLVDDSQKIHIQDCNEDCVKMWEMLVSVHLQKKPGARFNTYDDLFSIRKQEDESLSNLMNRVNGAMRRIKDLRPKDFTLDILDSELSSMAMICSLPDDYSSFISSLLMKVTLTTSVVQQAFITEDIQHTRHGGDSLPPAQASVASATPLQESCTFCGMMKHTLLQCYKFQNAQKLAKEEVVQKRKGKCAKASGSESKETAQIAANVSPCPAALQTPVTDFSWNADASSIVNAFPIEGENIGTEKLSNGYIYI